MRSIAIIGAGQAGLSLAIVLQKLGYTVTLYSNRTADEIRKGRILSTQAMFDDALQFERKWGLNYWDKKCLWKNSVTFSLGVPGEPKEGLHWKGKTQQPYQSIDQRIKFPHLLEEFEKMGGKLIIEDVDLNRLNTIAEDNELTIIAGGKGEISQCFARDNNRSPFDKPMRALTCIYVSGMIPDDSNPGVRANIIPGVGEYFSIPCLSHNGTCDTIFLEGIPGGPFDCFKGVTDPNEQLKMALELLKQYVPWEAKRCENVKLIDDQATLTGRFPPTVREPVAKTPSGKLILGMADTVVLNDPVAGQGSNNAGKCAEIYLQSIIERGDKPFDEEWMRSTFEKFWEVSGEPSTKFSNMLLLPPPPHVIGYLDAATRNPLAADKFSHAFENPSSLFPWILDVNETKNMIEKLEAERNREVHEKKEIEAA